MGWKNYTSPANTGSVTVGSDAPNDSLTGTTAKTLLRTVAINAALLGNTGRLRFALGSTNTNNANSKTLTVALWDGTTEVDLVAVSSTTLGKTIQKSMYLVSKVSQWFNGSISGAESSSAATPGTATLNLNSGTLELRIYGTLASAADTMTLTRYHISANYGG